MTTVTADACGEEENLRIDIRGEKNEGRGALKNLG
jgi:hypothetical protein